MSKYLLLIATLLFTSIALADERLDGYLVSYKSCKKSFEEGVPFPGVNASTEEEIEYDQSQRCSIWALASLIALQSAKAICTDSNYNVMQRAISLAYAELSHDTGEKMVWTYAQVAMAMFPCESTTENPKEKIK